MFIFGVLCNAFHSTKYNSSSISDFSHCHEHQDPQTSITQQLLNLLLDGQSMHLQKKQSTLGEFAKHYQPLDVHTTSFETGRLESEAGNGNHA